VLARGAEIDLEHLPPEIAGAAIPASAAGGSFRTLASACGEFERDYVVRALQLACGSRGRAAELLGISRKNLWEKTRRYAITGADVERSPA